MLILWSRRHRRFGTPLNPPFVRGEDVNWRRRGRFGTPLNPPFVRGEVLVLRRYAAIRRDPGRAVVVGSEPPSIPGGKMLIGDVVGGSDPPESPLPKGGRR